jgi:D-glycero-D-manno-heptose 1,7-bisphosphate phosphatase
MKQPAVFLDRDGVINENRADYVKDWSEVTFLPGALDALCQLAETEFIVVLITNQSAAGRGIISLEKATDINQRVINAVQARGGRIDRAYLCPHHPDEDCACRKPQPGMLLQAEADLNLNLCRSFLVGDALTDIQAALAAGVHPILVLTGRGQAQVQRINQKETGNWPVVADLGAAVNYILKKTGRGPCIKNTS